MALWSKLKGELVDIVEWLDDTNDTMVYRFERYGNEIKHGAKLVVRESQVAVLIDRGQLADVFQPGMYTLETKNLPILSTLMGWKHGFESPFKAECYFVNTRNFTDQKWGTKNPIMLRDPEFGPVRLRAFGTYAIKVSDAATFIREIVGTDGEFTTDEVTAQLRNILVARFTDALGECKIPILDLAANYDEMGELLSQKIGPEFGAYGLDLTKLLLENISLPPAVEEALDKRSSMGVIGNLGAYTQFQAANAMEAAAQNPAPGAAMGGGMGMGMGFAMANQMGQAMAQPQQQQAPAPPPPPAAAPPPPQPPPLPPPVSFFAAIGGAQAGPFDAAEFQQGIAAGQITRETLVWKQGMANWTAAAQVPELASLFAAAPPPLPPPQG